MMTSDHPLELSPSRVIIRQSVPSPSGNIVDTSKSFLDRLRDAPDESLWGQFVDLYTPLIRHWLRQHAHLQSDDDDLVQEVLLIVVKKIPEFRRGERAGSFRRWLKSITVNILRHSLRSRRLRSPGGNDAVSLMLDQLEDPDSALSKMWDDEHDRYLTKRLLEHIKPLFEAKTWTMFQKTALDGQSAATVAAELGVSENAVFIARSRVMAKLREEGHEMLD